MGFGMGNPLAQITASAYSDAILRTKGTTVCREDANRTLNQVNRRAEVFIRPIFSLQKRAKSGSA